MISETSAATVAFKAGTFSALLTLILNDANLTLAILIGLVSGLIFYFKEVTHLEIKSTLPKMISEFFFTIPMTLSFTLIIYMFGTKFVNSYYDLGSWFWLALSMMGSLHYKQIVGNIKPLFMEVFSVIVKIFEVRFGVKPKDKKDDGSS